MGHQGVADAEQFERYLVRHQVDREIDAIWNRQPLKKVIENRQFHAYYNRTKGYLLVGTKKRVARDATQRLASGQSGISVQKVEALNLGLLENIGKASGGYFGNLQIAKVKSVALFGPDVTTSDEWARYDEVGQLSALLMWIVSPDDQTRTVMLTRERVVVLYDDAGEQDNLNFVAHLQELIDKELSGA